MTERQEIPKKKKNMEQHKKKQYPNCTLMAYLSNQKKRMPKEKNNMKKVLFEDHT
jgi:hypothetical protein